MHRDLKLENILITRCEFSEDQDPLYDIRVSEFNGVCLFVIIFVYRVFENNKIKIK